MAGGSLLRGFWLLSATAVACLLGGASEGSSSHSLLYFRTFTSEPSPGLPQYMEVGYLDGQPIEHYDSVTEKMQPLVPWMNQSVSIMENYWVVQSTLARLNEEGFRHFLVILERFYGGYEGDSVRNSSCLKSEFRCRDGDCILWDYICDWSQDCKDSSDEDPKLCEIEGFHTLQCIDGCELLDNGTEKLSHREAYDGREMDDWEAVGSAYMHRKGFWGQTCIGWLRRHLEYRKKESRTETEPPEVWVIHKPINGSLETLVCNVASFFPKDITMVWLKDGKVVEEELLPVTIIPNADGTFQAQLSIQINTRDVNRYECHVDHVALQGHFHMGWTWSGSVWPIIGSIVGAIAAGLLVVSGIIFYIKKPSVMSFELSAH